MALKVSTRFDASKAFCAEEGLTRRIEKHKSLLDNLMNAKNIVLIGMPGAGKSTIGVLLAKEAGFDFLDTDIEIQNREECLLQDIVDQHGHLALRDIEASVCANLEARHQVIATGGSVVYSPDAMAHLRTLGPIIWLKVGYPEIEERIHNFEQRGLAKKEGQTLQSLFDERQPLYEEYAEIIISCYNKSTEEIVEAIKQRLNI